MDEEQKIRIGGIKFSEELIQISVACPSPDNSALSHLLQRIAEKNINIAFLCHSVLADTPACVFCVGPADRVRLRDILTCSAVPEKDVRIIDSVGMLTLFPHRNDIALLGRIVHFFGRQGFALHALCSSISALTVNTDYLLLDTIAEKLQNIVVLPENHAPFRQGFRVTQITGGEVHDATKTRRDHCRLPGRTG